MKTPFLEAGKIINTHGVRGEVKIEPWADDADFLRKLKRFYLNGAEMAVETSRVHGRFLITKFRDVHDINEAMALKNKVLHLNRADVKLPKGSFFLADIVGAKVVTEDGTELGELADVLELPAGNVYVVKGAREILIPAVEDFILRTDAVSGVITVRLIEGM